MTLVDISLVIELLENLLNLLLMVLVGCSDKLIIGGIHKVPYSLYLAGNIIDILLRCNTCCLCL